VNPSLQHERATTLRALHRPGNPIVLVNAWDVVSARLIERAGARAIATTSAGVAWALGYPDGERVSRAEMLDVVARIARSVSVPVTADLEAGYGSHAYDVAETVRQAIAAGAVGMNLEDARGDAGGADDPLFSMDVAVERVKAARSAADALGIPFVINARTDVYLAGVGDPATRFERAVERANAYREAGADSLFVPAVRDAETIERLVREIDGPLNVLAVAGTPAVAELARLGVARISVGGGAMRAALTLVERQAAAVIATGDFGAMLDDALPFGNINSLMQGGASAG